MADVKSLVKALKDMAVTQYGKGAPYRNALASALKGDVGGLQELNKPSPVMPNEALDVAMTFAPMGITKTVGNTFQELAKTGKMRQAKNKEQELNDLISGKSKFAEVRLNWDDPKTYDLADKLKAQGFDSTVTQQGNDMVTLFHKETEDVSPVLNSKTPYDFGKAYGYSDNDIAAFYNNKYGKDAEKYWNQDSLK